MLDNRNGHASHKSQDNRNRRPQKKKEESKVYRRRRDDYDLALDGLGSSAQTPIEIVLSKLRRVSASGDGWSARCPAHTDNSPSLSVCEGSDGKVLLTCHVGCDFNEIVEALGLEPADLFPKSDAGAVERTANANGIGGRKNAHSTKSPAKTGHLIDGQPVTAPGAKRDWASLVKQFQRQSQLKGRDQLAKHLGVRREDLEALGVGWAKPWGRLVYTFPEHDGLGRIVGISTRDLDDSKRMLKGSKRGLLLPKKWRLRSGPVFIVEGASDSAALACMGLAGIGRPSATGGVDHLVQLLASVPDSRIIIVLGEMDAKPDGSWPGRDAAESVAAQLASKLNRKVRWALPPDGAKDVRAWLGNAGGTCK